MRQGEPAFGHHLHEITKAEFVAQIPTHAEDDYFAIEMAAFEEFVHVEHLRQLYRSNNLPASYAAFTQFAPEPFLAGRETDPESDVRLAGSAVADCDNVFTAGRVLGTGEFQDESFVERRNCREVEACRGS